MKNNKLMLAAVLLLFVLPLYSQTKLKITEQNYFHTQGLDITFFADFYPEGHQSGVSIIQHGTRVAANGDLRLETSPGQWSPVPTGEEVLYDEKTNTLSKVLSYPDPQKDRIGFNPVIYPDLKFSYKVSLTPGTGNSFKVLVELNEALPDQWKGKVGFNLELFPGELFGESWIMDARSGIFPQQASGPLQEEEGTMIAQPLARGNTLCIAPDLPEKKITIESEKQELILLDGRLNHNNGWYIVRSIIPVDKPGKVLEWIITPEVKPGWKYEPVIQVSQLGYHPGQEKIAVIEMDRMINQPGEYRILKYDSEGTKFIKSGKAKWWGSFLRYNYAIVDFSEINEEGLYSLEYQDKRSHTFRIDKNIFNERTWQTTLEYFLPVQMCHMRINEKYRVWHDLCHMDDAQMAPVNLNHFDGYKQQESTLNPYASGDHVPGLNIGGWHDAGDYDLRVESQAGTVKMLAWMIEEFDLYYDATSIDQETRIVEIHQTDGKSDVLQQIEHGILSILGGYHSLGRLYRGIITRDLRQYVMLGDAASMTDNQVYSSESESASVIPDDDRWVFTEENPGRLLQVIPALAAASRVLKDYNKDLAKECQEVALELWDELDGYEIPAFRKTESVVELYLATGKEEFLEYLYMFEDNISGHIEQCGASLARIIEKIENKSFQNNIKVSVKAYQERLLKEREEDSPYGVPYKPNIWGAGWGIQSFGVSQYFFHKAWPELTPSSYVENALHFILGVHPGVNNKSFVSGVGANSVTTAYGVNRADWSYIPGGVASGTALIRPDLPELKEWPFFWQQTEYVMGGGATNFMFLSLAVDNLLN